MAHDESPTARALLTLELLQSSPGITAERLGERLRVTERAARRYIAILREAGIPVESERGPYGGYRLGRGMRTPLIFTTAEALGLVMALLDGHHDISDATGPVGSAVGKIGRVLPESLSQTVAAVRRTISAVPDRSAVSPEPDITTSLVQACDSRRRTTIAYTTEHGNERKMVVDPWAVVVRHARWYLLCWSHTADARRVLRVDRMSAVDIEETTFVRPEIDPLTEVEEHLGEGWAYPVEVVFDAPFAQIDRYLPRVLGRLEPIDDTHCRLVGSTNSPDWYAHELAGRAVPFHVIEGDEVRRCVATLGRRLLDAAEH
ncbi:putative DNA-binding transcriptional regulator YafY [Nocardioides albertanoniae]|uniref:Putative DNA-binding transcriptional regulator YafY n=1 Tax=Nocardioides albertanoniae TaxID=1175486 RepID=A0A543A1I8_9ACTN|nr:WYL domain-containing protein [Nocardioides albertanoniae]TQL66442.1 putative DNA-binding transcriptional regulator YafY [Nocardioides albertanoniae]